MDSAFCRAVILASLALSPCHGFEPGPRPAAAVVDHAGVLNDAARAEISLPLERIRNDVEVIAVVLTHLDAATPDDAAARMSATWCDAPLHALVLHIPGRDGSPWIVAGGDMIHALNPDEVRDELAAARRDAFREPDDASVVRTAASATADLLRYWKGREDTRLGVIDRMRAGIRRDLETRARRQQAVMLVMAIALIAFTVAGVGLLAKARRRAASKP